LRLGGSMIRSFVALASSVLLVLALSGAVQAAPRNTHAGNGATPNVIGCSSTFWKGVTANNWSNPIGNVTYSGSVILYGLYDSTSPNTFCGKVYAYASITTQAGSADECVTPDLHYEVNSTFYDVKGNNVCGGNGINNSAITPAETSGTADAVGIYSGEFNHSYSTNLETL